MRTQVLTKIEAFAFLALLLLTVTESVYFLSTAEAETEIIWISPESGFVGTNVTLSANVSALGPYKIFFDENEILNGIAAENTVTVHFVIPPAPQGSHTITVVSANDEKGDVNFSVVACESVEPHVPAAPAQLQEGANVTITVNITGGLANYLYPKIKVQTPRGDLNYTLKNGLDVVTDSDGTCLMNVTYPDDFSSGANTNFTGYYKIFFNETAVSRFFIGITNASAYHRGDTVNIKAVDYPVSENVTITIKFGDAPLHIETFTAENGTIDYNWLVKDDLLVSNSTHLYTVALTPVPSTKNFSDTQTFEIPGFHIAIFTQNLAGKAVPNTLVRVYDESARTYYTNVSGTNGYAVLNLDNGNYRVEAFFKEVKVFDGLQFEVPHEKFVNITCQLTCLLVKVESEKGVRIPHVPISVTYGYSTNYGSSENRKAVEFAKSDIDGIATFPNMLPKLNYEVNASLYGVPFNVNNRTIYNLPEADYIDITVLCPTRRLHVQVLDANNKPVPSANVKANELTVGLFVEGTAREGNATLACIFGKYSVRVFVDGVLLNETVVDLTSSESDVKETIKCQFYGLNVNVKVVDYFGQPIYGAKTMLQHGGLEFSSQTDLNGIATFSEIVGVEIQITIYVPSSSEPYIKKTIYIEESTTLTFRASKYVSLLGFLVETSHVTTMVIVALTALFIVFEVYRRGSLKRVFSRETS